jgi:hypothetical protein
MGGSARTAALVRLISSQCTYNISTAAPLGFSPIACREFSNLPAAGNGTAATKGTADITCRSDDGNSTAHTVDGRADWLQHRIAALPWRPSALNGWGSHYSSSSYGHTSIPWIAMPATDEERKGEQHRGSQDGTLMPLDRPSASPAAYGMAAAKQLMPAAGLSAAQLACAEPSLALLSFMTPFGRGGGGWASAPPAPCAALAASQPLMHMCNAAVTLMHGYGCVPGTMLPSCSSQHAAAILGSRLTCVQLTAKPDAPSAASHASANSPQTPRLSYPRLP